MKKNKPKETTCLFVDGTNLYAGQYELFGPKEYLDFSKLISTIESSLNSTFHKIYFYASYSPKPKNPTARQKQYLKNEAFFYKTVRKARNLIFFKGYRSPTSGKEKEVDVKLTADLVSYACLHKYDCAYLFSGDADFLQALFAIQPLKKKIKLLCLQNKIMFKGTYYFKTYIVCFHPLNRRFQSHQKIEKVTLLPSEVMKTVR